MKQPQPLAKDDNLGTRILHVTPSLGSGGVEKVLANYFEQIRNSGNYEFSFDFIVHGEEKGIIEEYFSRSGSKIYHAPPKRISPYKNFIFIAKVIRDGHYDVVHAHQNLSNAVPLVIAKYYGVPVRISHGHGYSAPHRLIAYLAKKVIEFFATDYFACSDDVGKWLHPKKWTQKPQRSFIMRNAFDLSRFSFSDNDRISWRQKLHLGSFPTMVQLGRLSQEKNHSFTLSLFQELSSSETWKLLIVGEGPLEIILKKQVSDLGLTKNVIFMGYQNDISGLLSAADLAVMPSTSEGLGLAAVEAQASGLPVVTSDAVPYDARVTSSIYSLPLDLTTWLEKINEEKISGLPSRLVHDERLKQYSIAPATLAYLGYLRCALHRSRS